MIASMETMTDKICVVTGATSGIGRETAKALALKGAVVIIVGRNVKKCIATVNSIKQHTGSSSVNHLCADLSDLKQVYDLAQELKQSYPKIDVLVNNAGAYFKKRRYQSVDGYEMTLALNYLSPFLLTNLLVDSLRKSEQGFRYDRAGQNQTGERQRPPSKEINRRHHQRDQCIKNMQHGLLHHKQFFRKESLHRSLRGKVTESHLSCQFNGSLFMEDLHFEASQR